MTFPCPDPEHGPPDELEKILGRTLGVPIFQEQAMKIAIDAAQVHAPRKRTSCARRWRRSARRGNIEELQDKMVGRMVERGYDPEFAQRCFDQIKGFGEYGFPESHAASFAHLVYVSSWLKWRYPAAFACALLNSQPMGFYAPAQIVRDAREHGVEVRAVDVNHSDWDCTLEDGSAAPRPAADRGTAARCGRAAGRRGGRIGRSRSLRSARAACRCMRSSGSRRPMRSARSASTGARRYGTRARSSRRPTCRCSLMPRRATKDRKASRRSFPPCRSAEHVVNDYQTIRLSLKAHPMRFLREHYAAQKFVTADQLTSIRDGRRLSMAGLVLIRQRPGSAKGVVLHHLEDETGIANLVVWPDVFEKQRKIVMGARLMAVHGIVQRDRTVASSTSSRGSSRTIPTCCAI